MTRIGKKTQRALAVLAAFFVVVAGYTGLCVFGYVQPPLPLAIIASWATQNHSRPALIDWDISRENWNDSDGAHERIGAALKKAFPPGTREVDFIAALQRQGFHFPRPLPNDCAPNDHRPHCVFASEVPGQQLAYDWGGLPCGERVSVSWLRDDQGNVASLDGRYGASCL